MVYKWILDTSSVKKIDNIDLIKDVNFFDFYRHYFKNVLKQTLFKMNILNEMFYKYEPLFSHLNPSLVNKIELYIYNMNKEINNIDPITDFIFDYVSDSSNYFISKVLVDLFMMSNDNKLFKEKEKNKYKKYYKLSEFKKETNQLFYINKETGPHVKKNNGYYKKLFLKSSLNEENIKHTKGAYYYNYLNRKKNEKKKKNIKKDKKKDKKKNKKKDKKNTLKEYIKKEKIWKESFLDNAIQIDDIKKKLYLRLSYYESLELWKDRYSEKFSELQRTPMMYTGKTYKVMNYYDYDYSYHYIPLSYYEIINKINVLWIIKLKKYFNYVNDLYKLIHSFFKKNDYYYRNHLLLNMKYISYSIKSIKKNTLKEKEFFSKKMNIFKEHISNISYVFYSKTNSLLDFHISNMFYVFDSKTNSLLECNTYILDREYIKKERKKILKNNIIISSYNKLKYLIKYLCLSFLNNNFDKHLYKKILSFLNSNFHLKSVYRIDHPSLIFKFINSIFSLNNNIVNYKNEITLLNKIKIHSIQDHILNYNFVLNNANLNKKNVYYYYWSKSNIFFIDELKDEEFFSKEHWKNVFYRLYGFNRSLCSFFLKCIGYYVKTKYFYLDEFFFKFFKWLLRKFLNYFSLNWYTLYLSHRTSFLPLLKKGIRFIYKYPSRGQRTSSNYRTINKVGKNINVSDFRENLTTKLIISKYPTWEHIDSFYFHKF